MFSIHPITDDDKEFDIGSDFGKQAKTACRELIKQVYTGSNRSAAIPTTHLMKIRLTNDIPLYCSPRRLSYSDRLEVDEIVSDLLKEGIIRPSNSPFASPIVLVRKKMVIVECVSIIEQLIK